jgi:hypothetical protein
MSVVITAVAPVPGGIESAAAPSSPRELALTDFVANQTAASGMPHLANPAALASELFGNLRGYVERTQTVERRVQNFGADRQNLGADGNDGVRVALGGAGGPRADLHGGPARENLEPVDASGGGASATPIVGIAELERAENFALEMMQNVLETTLVVSGTKATTGSVQNMLKGQ